MEENINTAADESQEPVGKSEGDSTAITELAAKFNALEENLKAQERINSKKEVENRQLREQLNDRGSDRDLMKAFVATIAEQKGVTEEELEENIKVRKPDLLAQYEELEKTRETKRIQSEYTARADAIWKDVKDLPESDENRDFVYTALMAGLPDKAEARIKKMTETPKVVEPLKPTEEEIAEAARRQLEEAGQLSNDLPIPSGTGKTYTPEYVATLKREAGTPAGLKRLMEEMPEIEKADKEGRLK